MPVPPLSSSRGVLITRPEPGLGETASAVAALGWEPVLAPALHVTPCRVGALPRQVAALLLTSGQAVAMAAESVPPFIPVFAVGERTAQKAREAGFATVHSAGGDARALEHLLLRHCTPGMGSLLLYSGMGQGMDLASSLRVQGFRVVRRVAYRADPVVVLPASVNQALLAGQIAAILFFSARSAQCWLKAARAAGIAARVRGVRAVVISEVVAKTLRQSGWQGPVSSASTPDAPAMLAALGAWSA